MLATSLPERLCQAMTKAEAVLLGLIDRTARPCAADYYDIDRQVVRMLPDDLTIDGSLFRSTHSLHHHWRSVIRWEAREAVQQSLDYTVAWYLTKPATIIKTLQEVYKLVPRA
jgi:hypothetical protein